MRQRFVLCGLSRLTVRVAQTLHEGGADVRVVRLRGEGSDWAGLLPPEVLVSDVALGNLDAAMAAAQVGGATCLLALSDDDLDNIRASVVARAVAPDVPVVLRAFDPILADQLEDGLNVRRAFSVSALAAPAFVAAACGDDVLETMRMGDGEVPICRLTVRQNSPLVGRATRRSRSVLASPSSRGQEPMESGRRSAATATVRRSRPRRVFCSAARLSTC